nr:immunoglobulin light chain junction region [Macaca mulatta]MOW15108.1 immunoglobulin light chain junction region [Macaca mulatta]MOW15293.1 immunoglobulin light chain junction region [Macaca mulatta]MOW15345.1 immunoglobulin light chain junction region [Macaca mulatta]MOW15360.1 immunoglobulin light chain junction region [Macaca mulatta]
HYYCCSYRSGSTFIF